MTSRARHLRGTILARHFEWVWVPRSSSDGMKYTYLGIHAGQPKTINWTVVGSSEARERADKTLTTKIPGIVDVKPRQSRYRFHWTRYTTREQRTAKARQARTLIGIRSRDLGIASFAPGRLAVAVRGNLPYGLKFKVVHLLVFR